MNLMGLARLFVAASCCVFLRLDHAQGSTFAIPPDGGRQDWFLDMLQALVDVDGPGDPAKVGAILGVTFDKTVVTTSPSFSEHWGRSFERDEYAPTTKTWLEPAPLDYAYAGYWHPDAADAGVTGRPGGAPRGVVNFKYFESKRFGLPQGPVDIVAFDHLRDDSEVHILFEGIDRLACITLDDVKSHFPGIEHVEATDASLELYAYYPPGREDAGAVLTIYPPRGRCITQASVGDTPAFGWRYARAQNRFFDCLKQAAAQFCGSHPTDRQDTAFNAYARKRCGGVDRYYDTEARTNQQPAQKVDLDSVPTSCSIP